MAYGEEPDIEAETEVGVVPPTMPEMGLLTIETRGAGRGLVVVRLMVSTAEGRKRGVELRKRRLGLIVELASPPEIDGRSTKNLEHQGEVSHIGSFEQTMGTQVPKGQSRRYREH